MRVRSALGYVGSLVMALPSLGVATTIVGIWTERQITIAADSKQTLMRDGRIAGSQLDCKIYEVRSLIFALVRLAKAEEISIVDAIRNSRELTEQGTGRRLPEVSVVVGAESAV